jgi:hypothetical protein
LNVRCFHDFNKYLLRKKTWGFIFWATLVKWFAFKGLNYVKIEGNFPPNTEQKYELSECCSPLLRNLVSRNFCELIRRNWTEVCVCIITASICP